MGTAGSSVRLHTDGLAGRAVEGEVGGKSREGALGESSELTGADNDEEEEPDGNRAHGQLVLLLVDLLLARTTGRPGLGGQSLALQSHAGARSTARAFPAQGMAVHTPPQPQLQPGHAC